LYHIIYQGFFVHGKPRKSAPFAVLSIPLTRRLPPRAALALRGVRAINGKPALGVAGSQGAASWIATQPPGNISEITMMGEQRQDLI
jgi:hypothetical protein